MKLNGAVTMVLVYVPRPTYLYNIVFVPGLLTCAILFLYIISISYVPAPILVTFQMSVVSVYYNFSICF